MSYILEALKKSQQEREMGQVPRLQATAFDDPFQPARTQPWMLAAVALAVLAILVSLYAALRPAAAPIAPPTLSGSMKQDLGASPDATRDAAGSSPAAREAEAARAPDQATAAVAPASSQTAATAAVETAAATPSANAALRLTDPDDLSVAPQVLVVPAPAKPGERLPRGADELRRAVLGPASSTSVEAKPPSADSAPAPERQYTPVPPELVAEIEAFKRTYQADANARSGAAGEETPPARRPAAAASTAGSDRPAPLSSRVRRQLPPLLMTVHVYDEDPERRFVYLNGSKVREGELTRDGFFVEQVLADGAIVRYDEHRFFQSP